MSFSACSCSDGALRIGCVAMATPMPLPRPKHRTAIAIARCLSSRRMSDLEHHLFVLRDSEDFFGGGESAEHFSGAVVEQRLHAGFDRPLLDRARVRVLEDQRADRIVDHQELVDAASPAISGLEARRTADLFVDRDPFFPTLAELRELVRARDVRLLARGAERTNQ